MKLSELLQDIVTIDANDDHDVTGISLDSRKIKSNDVFVALKGAVSDGRTFIDTALAQGAAAVLVESDPATDSMYLQRQTPIIPVTQLKTQLSEIASRFYDYPSRNLRILGVTGTNGKTSCTHFFAQCLALLKHAQCGIIGTLGFGFPRQDLREMGLTTPDAIQLQAILQTLKEEGAEAVAMEVSSHSIDQCRIESVQFEIGLYTNLSQDHLDYHGDIASYAAVKKRFLTNFPLEHRIINADDAYGSQWIRDFENDETLFLYGIGKSFPNHLGIYADNLQMTGSGMRATVHSPWGEGVLHTPMLGKFNLSNLLGVLSALCLYGIPFHKALAVLQKVKPVAGRMQRLGGNGHPTIVIDYSHTPDALSKALQALKAHTAGKLICVFGCGGNRDHGKRPQMAQIAEQWADKVIVTNDNPRHETPEAIAEEIMSGFVKPKAVTIELDRSKAIQKSIQWAKPEDCVLIAGKGAERYQQFGDEKKPFDDVEEAKKYLC